MDYRTLIGEIIAGGLKRMREQKRAEKAAPAADKSGAPEKVATEKTGPQTQSL